jgi:hypothetical protein
MRRRSGKAIVGVLAVSGLVLSIAAAGPILSQARDTAQPASGEPSSDFCIDVTTDRQAYGKQDVLSLTLKLLNNSATPVYVGPGIEAASLAYRSVTIASDELYAGVTIGSARLTRLGIIPIAEKGQIGAAGTETAQLNWQGSVQWSLVLFGPAEVAGHATRVISVAQINLGCARLADPNSSWSPQDPMPEGLCRPLDPGFYLLDCRVDGIPGAGMIQAQHVIEIKS